MLEKIHVLFSSNSLEVLDQVADRIGLTSIFASIGLTAAQDVLYQPWALTDYALIISCAGGILFIIEKLFVISIRYRERRRLIKEELRKRKSRKLP